MDRYLCAALDALPVPLWCAGADGAFLFQNRCLRACVAAPPRPDGHGGWLAALAPPERAAFLDAFAALRRQPGAADLDLRMAGADGRLRRYAMHVEPVLDDGGRVLHWQGCLVDVEEIALLRQECQDVFDEAPIPYVHEAVDTRLIRVNQAALKVLGIKPEQIPGLYGKSLLSPSSANLQVVRTAFGLVEQGRDADGFLIELRRLDNGNPVWVQWWSRPSLRGDYTRTMMVDVTDRVLAEQARAALEFTLEAGHVGDWDLNLADDTSRSSLRHDQCFGYSEAIAEGLWGLRVMLDHVHGSDRERVESGLRAAIAAAHGWECEFKVVWPDGSVHWLAACGNLYQPGQGQGRRMLGIVMEITERKRSEEALRETSAVLEFVLTSAHVGNWDLDLQSDTARRALRHDQCFGYREPIAEWGIEIFIQHIHSDDRVRIRTSMGQAVAALRDWAAECRVIWPDGSVHWIAARGSIYRSIEGKATRMLGSVIDITERKLAEETQLASEQLAKGHVDALKRTMEALSTESDPDRLVEHILLTIVEQFQAHSISAWARDMDSDRIRFEFAFEERQVIHRTAPEFAGLDQWLPMDTEHAWYELFRANRPDLIADIRLVPRFPLSERLIAMGIVTVLLIPISISGRLEGALGIRFAQQRQLTADDIELARALANHAMLALQLSRLTAQGRAAAVVAERNRMARDIHDTLAQGFTGIIVQLAAAQDAGQLGYRQAADEHLDRASNLARDSLAEARRSVQALRPQALDDGDWCRALQKLLKKVTAGTPLNTTFTLEGRARPLLPGWDEHLLRIGQEALTNTIRHAQASRFAAAVSYGAAGLRLELADDGIGFEPERDHAGLGLQGMAERVDCIGGTVRIASDAARGTTITVEVPLPGAAALFS
ncbi:PAS domain-containing protein [Rugamonas sp.]|uniref:PAS domain-containing protein n=1 Tax=Rugamonas sp. TaxID=1926287 RepID=UPI0025F5CDB9|nr:PAS domain-containing protein [Rugamonas sp.]